MTDHTPAAQAAKQDPISEAISILTADAASIRESHTPPCDRDDWNSEPETKAYYDRLLRVAGELSKLRAHVADERELMALADAVVVQWQRADKMPQMAWGFREFLVAGMQALIDSNRVTHGNDALVGALARLAYYYAVELESATRNADSDRLEGIAQRVTAKLKGEIRAALASAPMAGEAQPVCWIEKDVLESVRDEGSDAWVYWRPAGHVAEHDEMPLYAAPQASEAVRQPDYTLQHADHMAVSAERLMEAINARDALIMQREESDDVDDETIHDQHENVSEYLNGMRNAIYEYRKRRNRAALSAQPGAQKGQSDEA